MFEAFESEELSSCEEGIAGIESHFPAHADESAIEAIEIFDEEATFGFIDDQARMMGRQEGIGRESGVTGASEDGFIEFEGNTGATVVNSSIAG